MHAHETLLMSGFSLLFFTTLLCCMLVGVRRSPVGIKAKNFDEISKALSEQSAPVSRFSNFPRRRWALVETVIFFHRHGWRLHVGCTRPCIENGTQSWLLVLLKLWEMLIEFVDLRDKKNSTAVAAGHWYGELFISSASKQTSESTNTEQTDYWRDLNWYRSHAVN